MFTSAIPSAKAKDTRESVFDAGMYTSATVRAALDPDVHVIGKTFFALDAVVEGVVSTLPANTEISESEPVSSLHQRRRRGPHRGTVRVKRGRAARSPSTASRPSRRRSRSSRDDLHFLAVT